MSQETISDLQNLNIDFPLNPKILWKTSILISFSLSHAIRQIGTQLLVPISREFG